MSETENHFVGKVTQKAILFGPTAEILLTWCEDHWEPPGGTFEYSETLVGGLRREIREELGIDCRVGPPVGAVYGAWRDGETGDPMVTVVYRCETETRDITLNEEHDSYEWCSPETAIERFGSESARWQTVMERAVALDDLPPFDAVADPYTDTETSTEEVLDELDALRRADPPEES